ncbi:MAG: hypothetical protein Q9183_003172 [Haloplaca sp. 2 TL-2023]
MIAPHGLLRTLRLLQPRLVKTNQHRCWTDIVSKKLQDPSLDKRSYIARAINQPRLPEIPAEHDTLQDKVRGLMRTLPHPLTIIAAQSKKSHHASGLLVSSFNTITLDPTPHVSFNLKLPSSTYDEMRKDGIFTASAIKDVDIAQDFLRDKQQDPEYEAALIRNVSRNAHGRLAQQKGGLWWMRCRMLGDKCVRVGDHVVVVGEVVDAQRYPDRNVEGKVRGEALIYCKGKYRYAGPTIEEKRNQKK